jgi:non-specific serine/threonine protein kinase/serine/threonine-protein kinase
MAQDEFPPANPPDDHEAATRAPEPSESRVGSIIGPYRLLELIGEGGMGQVWLAEQREPVRRRVAIKLIKAGMDTREVVARFQSERQALALMDHPAIAKVFDAGSTLHGRPYFVMEYVAGLPITAYADKHKLTTRQRLELFMLVCDGVQHAHQKAIIHRDLKPSNILVSEIDGKPMPRIIDFGVAKATSQRLGADTVYTQLGSMIGTMGYMSPEQADSGGEDIDTRTDVYSLGVVLYELLVGALPLDFRKVAYNEFLRVLREEDAPRPSTKLRTMGGESAAAAKNRGADPATLTRQLRGDPDAITLKALEKDRKRRYSSPSELAADIGRCLRHEPVTAHAPSIGYRAGKYVRRHWLGVAMASAMLLLLVGFAIAQTVALRRITRERDRADRITEFMTGMFKVSDPSEARGNSVTAREILDKASKDIETGLSNDPELQAKMMYTMGITFETLGLPARSRPLIERAIEIQRRVLGPEHPETLQSMHSLALDLRDEGHYPEAEKYDRKTLDIRRRVLGPEHPDTLRSMTGLANDLSREGHYAESEKLNRETLDIRRRILGPEHPDTLNSMSDSANDLRSEGHFAEAEKMDREILASRRRIFGPDLPVTLGSMNNLANDLSSEGHYAEAEKLLRETLDIERRVLGPEHLDTLTSASNLADTLRMEGQNTEAEKLDRETLDLRGRILGPEHRETLESMSNLANDLRSQGRHAEAEKLDREALDIFRRVLGPEHSDTLSSMSSLASDLSAEGRHAEAEKLDRETLDIRGRTLGREYPGTLESMNNLADDLTAEGQYAEAEKLYREELDIDRRVFGTDYPETALAAYNLGCILARQNKRDEALSLLREAVEYGLPRKDVLEMEKDPDLKSLRGDPRFEALVARARQPAAQKTQ